MPEEDTTTYHFRKVLQEENSKLFASGFFTGALMVCVTMVLVAMVERRSTRAILSRMPR